MKNKLIFALLVLFGVISKSISQTQCEIYKSVLELLNERKTNYIVKNEYIDGGLDSTELIDQYKYYIVSTKRFITQNNFKNKPNPILKKHIRKKLVHFDLDSISSCNFEGKNFLGFIPNEQINIRPNYEISESDSINNYSVAYQLVLVRFSEILVYKNVFYLGMHLGYGLHNHPGVYYDFKIVKRRKGMKIKIIGTSMY